MDHFHHHPGIYWKLSLLGYYIIFMRNYVHSNFIFLLLYLNIKHLFQVCTDPKICHTTQLNSTAFPSGGIPMTAVSPLTGLIQWCALAPLYILDSDNIGILKYIKFA